MKRALYLLPLFLMACVFKPLEVELLEGKWEFVDGKEFENGVFVKDTINLTTSWLFSADGVFVATDENYIHKGSWKKTKKTIEIKMNDAATEKWEILDIDFSSMTIKKISPSNLTYEWNLKAVK